MLPYSFYWQPVKAIVPAVAVCPGPSVKVVPVELTAVCISLVVQFFTPPPCEMKACTSTT